MSRSLGEWHWSRHNDGVAHHARTSDHIFNNPNSELFERNDIIFCDKFVIYTAVRTKGFVFFVIVVNHFWFSFEHFSLNFFIFCVFLINLLQFRASLNLMIFCSNSERPSFNYHAKCNKFSSDTFQNVPISLVRCSVVHDRAFYKEFF